MLRRDHDSIMDIEGELANFNARREDLQRKLDTTRMACAAATAARHNLLAGDFDDADLAKVDQRVADAQRALAGVTDACSAVDAKIAEAQSRLDAAREKHDREREAERAAEVIAKANKSTATLVEGLNTFTVDIAGLGFEGEMAAQAAQGFREQIQYLAGNALRNGDQYRRSILDGSKPLPAHARTGATSPP